VFSGGNCEAQPLCFFVLTPNGNGLFAQRVGHEAKREPDSPNGDGVQVLHVLILSQLKPSFLDCEPAFDLLAVQTFARLICIAPELLALRHQPIADKETMQ
jgi:hypothetical protein